jgi:hypothetical protein
LGLTFLSLYLGALSEPAAGVEMADEDDDKTLTADGGNDGDVGMMPPLNVFKATPATRTSRPPRRRSIPQQLGPQDLDHLLERLPFLQRPLSTGDCSSRVDNNGGGGVGFAAGGFLSQFLSVDPKQARAVAFLEANNRLGWDFFGELLTARQALGSQERFEVLSPGTARALANHPFLN